MCCIFTWLAWCFDASHRVVVFIMACLISSSFCCLLLTASMAGVAMGYNYSLAEYIDLKETNISVYIKRGVYDDEIADDFDWRRSGKDSDTSSKDNLRSGDQPKFPGRQNSIFESEGENKYEGALMRLTSSATFEPMRRFQPEPPYATPKPTTNVVDGLLAVADNLPGGSMERLKAIQAAARYHENKQVELATAKFPDDASARVKAIEANAQIHDARRNDPTSTTDKYAKYFKQLALHPGFPGSGLAARRFDEQQQKDLPSTDANRFRDAVFGGKLAGWPTMPPPKSTTGSFFEYEMNLEPPLPADAKPPKVLPLSTQAWDMSKSQLEDSNQGNEYEDSNGLPSRKKRSHDDGMESKSIDDINFFDTKLGAKLHNHVDEKLVISIDADDDTTHKPVDDIRINIVKQNLETKSDHANKNKNINALSHATTENNGYVLFNEFIRKYLENLTSFGNKERREGTHRKRKRSMGYDYKQLGNKPAKSFWWRISNSAQKQWNRVIMYEDKLISEIADLSANIKKQLKGKIMT